MHKISWHSYFLKHATSDQHDKTFLLAQKNCPQGLSLLALELYISTHLFEQRFFIYMYLYIHVHVWNKTKCHIKIMRQKGSFWNWCKMMGTIKALKCCQNMFQVGLFWNDDPGLTLTIFMTGSYLFLMLLYGWQLIEHWVLLYIQVCSNSAYLFL